MNGKLISYRRPPMAKGKPSPAKKRQSDPAPVSSIDPGNLLKIGADPPIVTPWCERCDMPAERFCMDVVTSPYYVGIHAQCCGYTSSARVSVDEIFRIKRNNEKFYVIVRKGSTQGLSTQAKR